MIYCLMAMQCNRAIHHPALGQGLSLVLPLKVAGGLLRLMKCAFSEEMRGGNWPGRSTQKGWRKGVRWDYNLGSWSFGMIFHTWHTVAQAVLSPIYIVNLLSGPLMQYGPIWSFPSSSCPLLLIQKEEQHTFETQWSPAKKFAWFTWWKSIVTSI